MQGFLSCLRRSLYAYCLTTLLLNRFNNCMIEVNNIVKDFRKTIKKPGLAGSIASLFKPEYETVRAVNDVSFEVPEGEILGFIGPNGAGKSTVIKMLTGILTPNSGSCRINGYIPQKERKKYVREIGVVFGRGICPYAKHLKC